MLGTIACMIEIIGINIIYNKKGNPIGFPLKKIGGYLLFHKLVQYHRR